MDGSGKCALAAGGRVVIRSLAVLVLIVLLGVLGALVLWQVLQDAGYVLVVWQGWQMQTSVVVWVMLVLSFAVVSVLGLFALATLTSLPMRLRHLWRARRDHEALALAEQHAALSLLGQARQGQSILAQLVASRPRQPVWALWLAQTQDTSAQAQRLLERLPSEADDLVLLLQLDGLLAEAQWTEAASVLDLLLRQPREGLAQSLEPAFGLALTQRWCAFAQHRPWQALLLPEPPARLSDAQWRPWLMALQHQPLADPQLAQRLLWRLDQQPFEQQQRLAADWLAVLAQMPEGQARGWMLGQQVLQQKLDLDVLRGWVEWLQPFAQPLGQLPQAHALLVALDQRYAGQPLLQLALVHVELLQGQTAAVQARVDQWPSAWLAQRRDWLEQAITRQASPHLLMQFIYQVAF